MKHAAKKDKLNVLQLLATTNFPGSLILSTLMMDVVRSS
jgi:hypothetical protein